MVTIKIYIEGGGEGKDLDSRFREAWTKFFKAAGLSGKMPRPVRGKGRANTFDLFSTAIKNKQPGEIPLLLLDSEVAFADGHTVWEHLKMHDGMEKPHTASDDHAYLMVQVMETWFIADAEAIRKFCGSQFKPNKIPAWPILEDISKTSIIDVLVKSTADCGEKQYKKGKISFEILGCIDPKKVADRCPNAKRLLDYLTK